MRKITSFAGTAALVGFMSLTASAAFAAPTPSENILFGDPSSTVGGTDAAMTSYTNNANFGFNFFIPQYSGVLTANQVVDSATYTITSSLGTMSTITFFNNDPNNSSSGSVPLSSTVGGSGLATVGAIGGYAGKAVSLSLTQSLASTSIALSNGAMLGSGNILLNQGGTGTSPSCATRECAIATLSADTASGGDTITNASALSALTGNGYINETYNPNANSTLGNNFGDSLLPGVSGAVTEVPNVNLTFTGTIVYDVVTNTPPPPTVPEPASMTLLGAGLVGLGAIIRRRRRS